MVYDGAMPTPMGWCLTGHHDECPGLARSWHGATLTCGCACHDEGPHVGEEKE